MLRSLSCSPAPGFSLAKVERRSSVGFDVVGACLSIDREACFVLNWLVVLA